MRVLLDAALDGSQMKFEMQVDLSACNLRALGVDYWHDVAEAAGVEVHSHLADESCDAFILSEASLLVFDRRVLMMARGQMRPHLALLKIVERVGASNIRSMIYKRLQTTTFPDDTRALAECLPGRTIQFGNADEHSVFLFRRDRLELECRGETSVEILMHGISDKALSDFSGESHPTAEALRRATGVDRIVAGFEVDDKLLDAGYSLNAVRGEEYYAIHVTPQFGGSHASFESNVRFATTLPQTIQRLLEMFRPRSVDLMLYSAGVLDAVEAPGYGLASHVTQSEESGFPMRFMSFRRRTRAAARSLELTLQ